MPTVIKRVWLVLLALAVGWLFLRFVIGGSEDDWICRDGEWVKHGYPSAPRPLSGCGEVEEGSGQALVPLLSLEL